MTLPQKNSKTPSNPIGDPKAFRGPRMKLEHLSKEERKADYLPTFGKSFFSFAAELAKIIIIALAIIIPIRTFVLQPFYVKGASMAPTFQDNEYLIIDEISYRFHQPRRGDVVVLRNPALNEFLIKRVIGLPNERILISDNSVTIFNQDNPMGVRLDESSYLADTVTTVGNTDVTLTSDQYFVLGDNRVASLDSRNFGPISRRDIIGRTAVRAWPIDRATTFPTPEVKLVPNQY